MDSLDRIIESQIKQEEYEAIMEESTSDDFFDALLTMDTIVGDEDESSDDFNDYEDDALIDFVEENE